MYTYDNSMYLFEEVYVQTCAVGEGGAKLDHRRLKTSFPDALGCLIGAVVSNRVISQLRVFSHILGVFKCVPLGFGKPYGIVSTV